MRGSSERSPINIAAITPKLQVDSRFPLSKYYRTADNILKQAHIYREEQNVVDLYILLIRFSSLVGETIPEHNEYPTFSPRSKAEYRKKLSQVIFELEKLKPLAQRELKKFNSSIASVSSSKIEAKKEYEWPQMSVFQGNVTIGPIQPQRTSNQVESHLSKLSLSLPPAKVETLSRHSFLGQNGLKSRQDVPVTQAKVQYPTYIDTPPVEIPRFEESKNKSSTLSEALGVDPFQSDAGAELASQLSLIRQPSPPPAAALVQNLPNTLHSATTAPLIPPWKVADPFPGPISMVQDGSKQTGGPKQLYISAGMMDEFLRLASRNTSKNLETCGVLAGSLKNASFRVTALIIPKQESTSDSCQTINEEEIFDWQDKRDLFQLGWIHTHPKQTCFMSSIDLHTHYSYQVMLPEAIAIVMAPTDTTRTWGIFRLSDPQGIKVIQNCQQRGFHPHEQPSDGSPLYEHCSHVLMSSKLSYEVVDLR